MARIFFIFLLIFIFCSDFTSGQSKKDKYKQKFIEGEYLLLEDNFYLALKNFLEAYELDSTNANINYQVGLCYFKINELTKSKPYFAKAVLDASKNYVEFEANEASAPVMVYYYMAKLYHLDNLFDDAILSFQRYRTFLKKRQTKLIKDVDRQIEMCNTGIEMIKTPASIVINNLGDSVNSFYSDYSPVLSADESSLIFTSRRSGSTGGDKTPDNQYYEDIYVCSKKDGKWLGPVSIGENINTVDNEATIGLSADGQQLFIYEGTNGGDIYYSLLEGQTWTVPTPMSSDVNSKFWETHACLSADGNTLYFVSDRPGGYGGRDIYRCVKLPNGKWSLASNLGPTVNTEYDEEATFIHPDGVTLFFSSQGHKGMGGFDIFHTVKKEDGSWTPPENEGYPINTSSDDIFYVLSLDGKRAYYSTTRAGGYGDKDIYVITLEDKKIVEALTLLKGNISFNRKNKVQPDIRIQATDMESGLVVQEIKPNSKTGKYIIILSPGANGKTYSISFEAEGYKTIYETIKIKQGTAYQEIEKGIDLKSLNLEPEEGLVKNDVMEEKDISKDIVALPIMDSSKVHKKDLRDLAQAPVDLTGNFTSQIADKKNPLVNSIVNLIDAAGKIIQTTTTDNNGSFKFSNLPSDQNYIVALDESDTKIGSHGKLLLSDEHGKFIKEITHKGESTMKFPIAELLSPVITNANFENILFEYNKSNLTKEGIIECQKVVEVLKSQPKLKIGIYGHADNKGNHAVNLALSQARAKSVVNYLVLKGGIKRARLLSKGFGKTMPIAPNQNPDKADNPAGRKLNRRVEIKIIQPKKKL